MTVIKKVGIKNYRSISSAILELGKITVIVGPSDSGKSNLVRALRDCFYNVSGNSFVSHGSTYSRISMAIGSRKRVTFEKGKKGSAGALYSIDEYEDVVLEGDRTFVEVEDPRNFVPNMATGKYTRGKFVVNDDDEDPVSHQDHIPDQLVDLLSPLHAMDSEKGEYLNLDEITEDSVIARFELSGGYLLYKANFTVDEDGKVSLVGTPTRIKDTIGTLSRKRTVPEMPAPRWRKDGRPDFSDLD